MQLLPSNFKWERNENPEMRLTTNTISVSNYDNSLSSYTNNLLVKLRKQSPRTKGLFDI